MNADRPTLADYEAEAMIVGAMMRDGEYGEDAIDYAAAELTSDDFTLVAYRGLYKLALKMREAHDPVNVSTVHNALKRLRRLDESTSAGRLMELVEGCAGMGELSYYAGRLREMTHRRALRAAVETADAKINDLRADIGFVQDEVESGVLAAGNRDKKHSATLAEVAEPALYSLKHETRGLRPFLGCLNRGDISFPDTEYSIIGGTRGTGKTYFALEETRYLCKSGLSVMAFSLEMPAIDVMQRLATMELGFALKDLRRGVKAEAPWMCDGRFDEAWTRLSRWPFTIDDRKNLSTVEIAASIRRAKRQGAKAGKPLGMVWIDYAQEISEPGLESGYKTLTEVSRRLAVVAAEVKVPILLLSQLTLEDTRGKDEFPAVHTTGARTLENAAGLVMYLYRPHRVIDNSLAALKDPNKTLIRVDKARGGGEERIYECLWRHGPGGFVDKADEEE